MALPNQPRERNWPGIIGAVQWLFDKAMANWDRLLLLLAGGGTMSWAAFKDWVWQIGPLGWVAAFWVGAFLMLVAMLLYEIIAAWADRRRALREMATRPGAVSVLQPEFRDLRISLSDFYNIFLIPNEGKTFTNFELIGPGNIHIDRSDMLAPLHFRECEFVLVRPDRPVTNVTIFRNCRFIGGKFVRCTFVVDQAMLNTLRNAGLQGNINLVTWEAPP